ncbi:MAG: rhodanese [Rhodobacteraceae bacterium]|nr:MAG: rhodanese [Paracoccaceae bacterium]
MPLALCLGLTGAALAQGVQSPQGYRQSDYDAPVPDDLAGAITIGDDAAYALWRSGRVVFIDVMPNLARPKSLPEDAVWHGRSRQSVPGAIWLPDVGFGTLDAAALAQLDAGLMAVTGGDRAVPMVFLCRANCWMSWNAAKRAVTRGYTHVFWYRDGSTGWTFWDWPTTRLKVFQSQ